MEFSNTFCSSPWIHMRIDNQGNYFFCRHAGLLNQGSQNIKDVDPTTFFQKHMSNVRMQLLNGEKVNDCSHCHLQDKHGKVSGRKKQLLKTGIMTEHFDKSVLSSPWLPEFSKSLHNNGHTDQLPVDWQIDLGNYCNAACVFCLPQFSSRLAIELKKLGLANTVPSNSWCNDPVLLDKFTSVLESVPNIKYMHFLGGETLITPAFKTILKRLIVAGKTSATIGFTTNLTVWDDETIELISQFGGVNVGLSIETFHAVNDYIRYPVKTQESKVLLDRWVKLSHENNWLVQIRITPTVFSILHLTDLYDYAVTNNTILESCNFISEPAHMRPTVLPKEYRQQAIDKLQNWLDTQGQMSAETIVNIRNPSTLHQLLSQDCQSYINYLQNEPDESHLLPKLVEYIKRLEQNRNNSILDYLPEYEKFLRSAGY